MKIYFWTFTLLCLSAMLIVRVVMLQRRIDRMADIEIQRMTEAATQGEYIESLKDGIKFRDMAIEDADALLRFTNQRWRACLESDRR